LGLARIERASPETVVMKLRLWTLGAALLGGAAVTPLACAGSGDDRPNQTSESTTGSGGEGAGHSSGGGEHGIGGLDVDVDGGGTGGRCSGSEICGDGIDNDCNGDVDDCSCSPGDTQHCFTGPASARGVGACTAGEQFCETKGEFGQWGSCVGEVLPADEVCDAAMVDENCDGEPNEGCECADGTGPVACGSDVGECVPGAAECSAGALGPCVGAVGPITEICNGLDDNCDDSVDEGLTMACGVAMGGCQPGVSACTNGAWGECTGGAGPTDETCNGVDDNCDGTIDEGLTQSCGTDAGVCVAGTETCANGAWGACAGSVGPGTETCNGLDDDCDGTVDEGCGCINGATMACGTDVGACNAGTQTCTSGAWGPCVGSTGPTAETCNAADDDCDGTVDEGLTQSCGSDVGECAAGTQTCTTGFWGACVGSVGPASETCNNKDDDCDGLKDESLTQQCGATDVGVCSFGTQSCANGSWGACMGSIGPGTEICGNALDEDCDGTADEVSSCPVTPPTCTCPSPSTINTQPLQTVTLTASCSDPDGGAVTYQWTVTSKPSGSSSLPASPNSASTAFFVDLAGTYTLTLTVTDNEGQTTTCTVTINSVPDQDLHVELVWNTAYGDADLHLTRAGVPPATAWYTLDDCFYANDPAAWPPNGGDGNASLDIDDTDGFGPENINISTNPANGTYEIGVAYYCQHSVKKTPNQQIDPGDGPTTATVKVFCGGVLIATYNNIQLDKTGRFVDVASVTWPGCAGMSKNTQTWTSLIQPAAYAQPLHCPLPCSTNANCGGGEVCQGGVCVLD
jgi:hypothetical protein